MSKKKFRLNVFMLFIHILIKGLSIISEYIEICFHFFDKILYIEKIVNQFNLREKRKMRISS